MLRVGIVALACIAAANAEVAKLSNVNGDLHVKLPETSNKFCVNDGTNIGCVSAADVVGKKDVDAVKTQIMDEVVPEIDSRIVALETGLTAKVDQVRSPLALLSRALSLFSRSLLASSRSYPIETFSFFFLLFFFFFLKCTLVLLLSLKTCTPPLTRILLHGPMLGFPFRSVPKLMSSANGVLNTWARTASA